MTSETIGTAATVMDRPHQSQPPRTTGSRWIWVFVGLAFAMLLAALALAIVRNIGLQEKLANCRAFAAKCVAETNEMARQYGNAARLSLAKLDEEEADGDSTEESPPALDGGIDGSDPPKAGRW